MVVLILAPGNLKGQAGLLPGKKVGVYLSSRAFDFKEELYIPIAQFLKLGEDRSYTGEMKPEFMIKLGTQFARQLGPLSGADTVLFLNANLELGRAFQQTYAIASRQLINPPEALKALDMVLVIDTCDISYRVHRSVYIRSNRMITERIRVKNSRLHITLVDVHTPELSLSTSVCMDEYAGPRVDDHFDFYREDSEMGEFLSEMFSQWWQQMLDGISDNCQPGD